MNIFYFIGTILLFSITLIDRFVYSLPDWLAIAMSITAAFLIGISIYKSRKSKISSKRADR